MIAASGHGRSVNAAVLRCGCLSPHERRGPGREAAVEEGGRLAEHAQHPHEARCGAAAGVVVGDDASAVPDAERAHRPGEGARVGERVAACSAPRRTREVDVHVDEACTRDVPRFEGGSAAATVQVPPDVAHDHIGGVIHEPRRFDEGPEGR